MSDWRAIDDLDEFGTETADDFEDLEQDAIHRIASPHGSNPDDPDLGLGVEIFLSGTPNLTNFADRANNELRKDARIDSVATVFTLLSDDASGSIYQVDIEIDTSDQTISTALAVGPNGVTKL